MNFQDYAARTIRVASACLALAGASALMATELELVRLNACEDVAEVLNSLKRQATSCRTATDIIERTIHEFLAGNDVSFCILERPPVKSLSNFKCIQASGKGQGTTACFRPVTASQLSDYKANYDSKYSFRVAAYLEEAKKCPGSNGDVSRIIDTTFPRIFWPIAEHEFGFNVQFGDTKPASSLVSHGFARTSPEVSTRGPEAIEYVVFDDGMATELGARTSLGNWRLRIDTSAEGADPFLKTFKRQGLDAYLASFDIAIERAPRASALLKVPSLPDELLDVVASRLEVEGFNEMSDGDLVRHTGQTKEEVMESVLRGVAFGVPNIFPNSGRRSIRLLMKTSGIPCTRNGNGAIGAYLFGIDGEEGVPIDFGSVSTVVLGFGACASVNNAGRKYVSNLARESKQAVLDTLKGR